MTSQTPHYLEFLPHNCRTFYNFRRTITAHFGILGQCGTTHFGKKYRTKPMLLLQYKRTTVYMYIVLQYTCTTVYMSTVQYSSIHVQQYTCTTV